MRPQQETQASQKESGNDRKRSLDDVEASTEYDGPSFKSRPGIPNSATGKVEGEQNAQVEHANIRTPKKRMTARVEKAKDARAPRGERAAPLQRRNDEEEQGSQLSSISRQREEMRASQKKLNTELTALRKTNARQQELLKIREAEILRGTSVGESSPHQDDELSRLRKTVQDQKHRREIQDPIVRQVMDEGARARAEVSREAAEDEDTQFKLEAIAMNLKYVSAASVIESVGEESLRNVRQPRGSRRYPERRSMVVSWSARFEAEDGSIAVRVLDESLDLRRRASQALQLHGGSAAIRGRGCACVHREGTFDACER